MKQYLIKFSLPKSKRVYPADFRKAIAKELDDPSQEDLFNYQGGQGADKYPLNRFVGGAGWVGFVSEESELVASKTLAPGIKVLNAMGITAGIEIIEHNKSMTITSEPNLFALNGGVDKRKNPRRRQLDDKAYIKEMVWKMLARAVEQNILPILPTEDELNLVVFDARSLGVKAGHNNGEGGLFYHSVSGQFSMNAQMTGLWQAGQLLSRGNGLIYRVNARGHYQC